MMEYRYTVTAYVFITFIQYSQRWISTATGIYTGDYCNLQQFHPQCHGGVVLMEHALYGRMRIGNCVAYDREIGCQADALGITHRKCSGRRECIIRIPDFDLQNTNPCPDMSNYLEASYSCLEVVSVTQSACAFCQVMKVTEPSEGYIASVTTKETRCGSEGCPWLVEAGRGQQVSVRLLDFSFDDTLDAGREGHSTVCPVYAIIKEPTTQKSTTICGGRAREENVYLSSGNALEIRVVDIAGQDKYFVLYYQFVGCTDPESVEEATFERKGDVAKYQCDITEDKWTLTCNGSVWVGSPHDCSAKPGASEPVASAGTPMLDLFNQPITSFSWEMALILLSIVTVGIVLCVLIVGCVCVKQSELKYRRTPVPTSEPEYALYDAAASRRLARSKYGPEEDGTATIPKDYKSTSRLYKGGQSTLSSNRTNGGTSRGYPYTDDGTRTTRFSDDTLRAKRFDPNTIESQRSHRYHNIPGELPPPRSPSPPSLPLLPQPPSIPSTPSPPSPPAWIEEDPDV